MPLLPLSSIPHPLVAARRNVQTYAQFCDVTGLVAAYPLAADATDIKNAHNGTASNVTFNQAGLAGTGEGAASFGGTNSAIALPNASVLFPSGTLRATVVAWAKPAVGAFGTDRRIVSIALTGSASAVTLAGGVVASKFSVYYRNSGGAAGTLTSTGTYSVDWHQVAAVVDAPNITLYVDGQVAGTASDAAAAATMFPSAAFACRIGSNVAGNGNWWSGLMQSVRLYTSALDGAAILAQYNKGMGS